MGSKKKNFKPKKKAKNHMRKAKKMKVKWFEVAIYFSNYTTIIRHLIAASKEVAIAKTMHRIKEPSNLGCVNAVKVKRIPVPKGEEEEDWE